MKKDKIIKEIMGMVENVDLLNKEDIIVGGGSALVMAGLIEDAKNILCIISHGTYVALKSGLYEETKFLNGEKAITIGRCDLIDPENLDEFECDIIDGFKVLCPEKVFEMEMETLDRIDRFIWNIVMERSTIEVSILVAQREYSKKLKVFGTPASRIKVCRSITSIDEVKEEERNGNSVEQI